MGSRACSYLVAVVLVGAALGAVPTSASAADDPQAECRHQWAELFSYHGENGNPRGPVDELSQRWDTYYATAVQFAESATAADCGDKIASYAATWDHLELLQYGLHRYDPLRRLEGAEADRRHALQLHHTRHLSPRLERAFRVARRQAPRAARDFAPALAPAATVDVDNEAAVQDVLYGLRRTARHSHHQQRLNRMLRIIGNAELNEE
jgi:hypothetical protein